MDNDSNPKNTDISKQDIIQFLNETDLGGYQSIDLPFGLKTPGMDRSKTADIIFKYPIKDKTILDIGCKYGYFCHEALLRGAAVVKGIEINDENSKIANKITEFWGRDIEIINGDYLELNNLQNFDITLLLNVIHHIESPVSILNKISNQTKELAIIEFPSILDDQTKLSSFKKMDYNFFLKKTPLIYLGNKKYHRIWYFSKEAFKNLVIHQLTIFKRVEFLPSPRKSGRYIAFCWKY